MGEGDVGVIVDNPSTKKQLLLKVKECPDCGDPVLKWEMRQGINSSWCGPRGYINLRTREDSVLLLFRWIRGEQIDDEVWYRELDRSQEKEIQKNNPNTELIAVARNLYNTLKGIVKNQRSMVLWEDLAKSIRSYRKALSLCCSRMSDEEENLNRRLWGSTERESISRQARAWMKVLEWEYDLLE